MTPREPSTARTYTDAEAIAALRLALEASADCRTLRKVVAEIVERAPATEPPCPGSVALLIEAIVAARATFFVTDNEPRGRVKASV